MVAPSQRRHLARREDAALALPHRQDDERSQGRRWPAKSRQTFGSGH
jgi:hypothetical protein